MDGIASLRSDPGGDGPRRKTEEVGKEGNEADCGESTGSALGETRSIKDERGDTYAVQQSWRAGAEQKEIREDRGQPVRNWHGQRAPRKMD